VVEINWTNEAQLWLRDIYNYIALDNRDAAERTVIGIFQPQITPITQIVFESAQSV